MADFIESYRTNEFIFEIGGRPSPGVSKVSGLSEGEIETIEQPDAGSGHVYKIAANKVKYESLTVERYVDGSAEDKRFQDWFKETFTREAGVTGGSKIRRSGMIYKFHQGEKVMTFAFFDAWLKSSKFTDLEAGSTGLLKQTIVLEHEGLERVE
ncbi:MAG: phage tail protein [Acidimicrobiia bacterium]|jgi:phage tail-like protein|nr:phage tail protein [Acidimicrobiia bacterium]